MKLEDFLDGFSNVNLRNALTQAYNRDADQPEFLQSIREVALSLDHAQVFDRNPHLIPVFSQLIEPERQIIFRVPWLDDHNNLIINRGYRVQANSALGPYKGGLRFHPSVSLSVCKFLAFEQTLKNSLTTMPLGGAKGGSDFDPKGKSNGEIMRFCQSFSCELSRHIGAAVDVPAGDIGVGSKEIGYIYGQWKRITNEFSASMTGKALDWGGSCLRPESTGYGAVYMAENLLMDEAGLLEGEEGEGEGGVMNGGSSNNNNNNNNNNNGKEKEASSPSLSSSSTLKGKRCLVSGAGQVARYCTQKLLQLGAIVITMSDSKGTVIFPDGLTMEDLDAIIKLKSDHNGKLSDFNSSSKMKYVEGLSPWDIVCHEEEREGIGGRVDLAFPCATQNEVNNHHAAALACAGVHAVIEGANMPCTAKAAQVMHDKKVTLVAGKMANAGGVAVSGLEMSQNKVQERWTKNHVDGKLKGIIRAIYFQAKKAAEEYGVDLSAGGNIAAFMKVAESMHQQGAV
jgi:glutamate dehydrogenase (NADP+)